MIDPQSQDEYDDEWPELGGPGFDDNGYGS